MASKYSADTERVAVDAAQAGAMVRGIMAAKGCPDDIASEVAEHLIDSDWSGVESHGVWRILPYAGYYDSGYLKADVRPELKQNAQGAWIVDGHGGIGIPAMRIATQDVVTRAKAGGLAAIALQNVGHTGRLGAFAEEAAKQGCLMIIIGGGGRENWRLVAPYGGRKALMSTNPYSIGIPGGDRGPVVVDFATSAAAAGWVYGAKIAGAHLPEGVLIDKAGEPTTNPQDYFDGGAILTAGGAKGYALSVAAEMIAEALLGPATTECNWLMLAMDCSLYREPTQMQSIAEDILDEFRNCLPAAGFDKVEIPGEREAEARNRNAGQPVHLPLATWAQIVELADALDVIGGKAGAPARR
ncbi:L-lactate dehydrogenase [Falsiruegeria litorea R37]|uniref:L-lactate dehydrogenase n=1 Tax=Falsiruegeria litorea R37 TaxID=1200284 RepID=A0A1Y5SC58_9RHOB|nr:Ldh family oxidoreductase [Falsiruegeria litorea]SLN35855.1 L-lactate dehydrogenase [Falsiruegeria litorea R37]